MEAERAVASLAGDPGFLLSRVGTAVQDGFKELLGAWGVRPQHFAILTALDAAGGASQQELCRLLGIDSGNMVELVDTLEAAGYVQRRRDPRDRRRYLVVVTGPGRSALAGMAGETREYTTRFFGGLDETELAALTSALTKLYATTPEGQRMPPRPEPARRPS